MILGGAISASGNFEEIFICCNDCKFVYSSVGPNLFVCGVFGQICFEYMNGAGE